MCAGKTYTSVEEICICRHAEYYIIIYHYTNNKCLIDRNKRYVMMNVEERPIISSRNRQALIINNRKYFLHLAEIRLKTALLKAESP